MFEAVFGWVLEQRNPVLELENREYVFSNRHCWEARKASDNDTMGVHALNSVAFVCLTLSLFSLLFSKWAKAVSSFSNLWLFMGRLSLLHAIFCSVSYCTVCMHASCIASCYTSSRGLVRINPSNMPHVWQLLRSVKPSCHWHDVTQQVKNALLSCRAEPILVPVRTLYAHYYNRFRGRAL